MNLFQAITDILHEILISPTLRQRSQATVNQWLSTGHNWGFIREFEQLLHIAQEAGISPSKFLTRLSLNIESIQITDLPERFFRDVPLPQGLTQNHLYQAMSKTEQMLSRINFHLQNSTDFPLINFIQANNFSGIVSNMLTDALDQISPYKHNHDQRFPDLKNPDNGIGLEMKAANKPGKGGESHNGHGGWHLIACFELDQNSGNIQFIHVEIAELISFRDESEGDWHYCGSTVDEETGSQRTETYYTTDRGTSKLRDGSVYLNTDKVTNWQLWRHCKKYAIPSYSPLYFQRISGDALVSSLKDPKKPIKWATIKSQLNKIDVRWPLYNRTELAQLGVPSELIEIIRPETT